MWSLSLMTKLCFDQVSVPYPMSFSCSESRSFLHVSFEELVGEMLCKKGKHQAGALWVRDKLPSHEKLLGK